MYRRNVLHLVNQNGNYSLIDAKEITYRKYVQKEIDLSGGACSYRPATTLHMPKGLEAAVFGPTAAQEASAKHHAGELRHVQALS